MAIILELQAKGFQIVKKASCAPRMVGEIVAAELCGIIVEALL